MLVEPFEQFKEHGLWKADCYIVLPDQMIIGIPYYIDDQEVWIRELDASAVSYYPKKKWWQQKTSDIRDLRGKKITDIIDYPESIDKAFFELDNGNIITEVTVAPIGIAVGLYLYESIKDLEGKFGAGYIRLTNNND